MGSPYMLFHACPGSRFSRNQTRTGVAAAVRVSISGRSRGAASAIGTQRQGPLRSSPRIHSPSSLPSSPRTSAKVSPIRGGRCLDWSLWARIFRPYSWCTFQNLDRPVQSEQRVLGATNHVGDSIAASRLSMVGWSKKGLPDNSHGVLIACALQPYSRTTLRRGDRRRDRQPSWTTCE